MIEQNVIKKNDYVFYIYDNEKLIARVTEVNGDKAKIEVCLSARRGEDTLLDEMDTKIKDLEKINKLPEKTEDNL